MHQVLDDDGVPLEGADIRVSLEDALAIHRTMLTNRRLDERMMILQRQGRVGFYGTATGQEAVPAALGAALRSDDWVFPGLREGALMLHRGFPLERYVAQIFGCALDPTRGRQMPSHQADASVHYVSWSSCIGSQAPQAVGMARAARDEGQGRLAVACFGDGASSTRDVTSALRLAQRWSAPCVFVCQNNHWAISIPTRGQTRADTLADRARGLGLSTARVDGNDALALHAAFEAAAAHARSGAGPVFVECLTYRIGAHSSADDPSRYRDPAEVETWRRRDPLARLERWLRDRGVPNERLLDTDGQVRRAIDEAIAASESAASVSGQELRTHVWDSSSRA